MRFKNLSKPNVETTNVRMGIIRTTSLSQELDSTTVVLTQVPKLDIEPYDKIELQNENNKFEYYIVGNRSWNIVKVGDDFLYDYTVDLVEPTKLLDTIILPSMTVTNIGQNRSITYYVRNALKMYFHDDLSNDIGIYVDINNFSESTYEIFDNIVCPEAVFSEPTLREYIDYFFNIKGYRCKLVYSGTGYSLRHVDFNLRSGTFPYDKCDTLVGSESAGDYVTQLTSTINDVVSPNYVKEYHKLKSEAGYYTEDTASLVLDYKPYDIKSLYVHSTGAKYVSIQDTFWNTTGMGLFRLRVRHGDGPDHYSRIADITAIETDAYLKHEDAYELKADPNNPGFHKILYVSPEVDIAHNLVTSEVFSSLQTLSRGDYVKDYDYVVGRNTNKYMTDKLYQNNTITWSRGSKEISGLFNYQKKNFILQPDDETAFQYAYLNSFCMNLIRGKEELHGEWWNNSTSQEYVPIPPGYYKIYEYTDYETGYDFIIVMNPQYCYAKWNIEYKFDKIRFEVEYRPYLNYKMIQRQPNKNHLIEMANSNTNAKTDLISFYEQSKEKNKQLGNETLTFYGHSDTSNIAFKLGQVYNVSWDTYVLNKYEYTYKHDIIMYKGTLTKDFSNQNIYTLLNREKRYYALPNTNESVDRHVMFDINDHLDDYFFDEGVRFGVSIYDRNMSFIGSLPVIRVDYQDGNYCFNFGFYDNVSINLRPTDRTAKNAAYKIVEYIKFTDDYGECSKLKFVMYAINENDVNDGEWSYSYDVNADNSYILATYEFETPDYFMKDARERLIFSLNKLN